MKKLVFGKGLNKREERDIKNYGKELNNMKKYLVKELGLSLTKAHKVIQTLNRNNKVIFNNGETSFFIKVKEVEEMKKLVAVVKNTEGRIEILKYEYKTKKAFEKDIKANGYSIVYSYIFTSEEYEKFLNEDVKFMSWFEKRLNKRRVSNQNANIRKRNKIAWQREDVASF